MDLTRGWRFRPGEQPIYSFERTGAFIDGVFAIAATLLVIELKIPTDYVPGHLADRLIELIPEYLVYAAAFLQVLGGWLVSRRFGTNLKGIDHYGTLMYLGAIGTYVLTPFTVRLVTETMHNEADLAAAVRTAGGIALASMLLYSAFVTYLVRRSLFRDDLDPEVINLSIDMSRLAWIWPVLTFALSYLNAFAALTPLLVLIVVPLLPFESARVERTG